MSKIIKQFMVIFLLFLGLIFVVYKFIPQPSIEGADLADNTYKVSFNAPITVHFHQKMNKKSVENSFQVYPNLDGEIKWASGNILEYYPSLPMIIGDKYRVIIRESARNIYGKSFGIDYTLPFEVTGQPFVQFVSPYFNTKPQLKLQLQPQPEIIPIIDQNQEITVMFDRPMQLEKIIEEEKDLLIIDPFVEGDYEIIGTSAFRFIPKNWPMGTRFQLKVPSGVLSRDGGATENEKVWDIQTPAPKIIETNPANEQLDIGINEPIIIKFNQKVDLNQIKPGNNVLIYPSNDVDSNIVEKNDGFFNTEVTYFENEPARTGTGGNGKDETKLIFKPTFPYQYNKEYRLVIKSGLGSLIKDGDIYRTLLMNEDFEFIFTTQKKPEVKKVVPKFGEYDYKESFIEIDFESAVTTEEIKNNILINPNTNSDPKIELYENNKKAIITYDFNPSTEYVFELKDEMKDKNGDIIKKGIKTSFKTSELKSFVRFKNQSNWQSFTNINDPSFNMEVANLNELNIKLCKIKSTSFFKFNKDGNWDDYVCDNPSFYTYEIDTEKNKISEININIASIFDIDLEDGLYNFSVSQNDDKISKNFILSDIAIILKKSEEKAVAWAVNLKTGIPEENFEITFYSNDGHKLNIGKTDSNGIYEANIKLGDGAYVIGKNQKNWALASEDWQVEKKKENNRWISSKEPMIYFLMNKSKYSSGEIISLKGWYRIGNGSELEMPKQKKVIISILKEDGSSILEEEILLRRNGSFDGDIKIPKLIRAGKYKFTVKTSVNNTEYIFDSIFEIVNKKDPLDIVFLNAKTHYIGNDLINFNLESRGIYGMPKPGLRATWRLLSSPISNNGQTDKYIKSGEIIFDEKGRTNLSLTPDYSLLPPENVYRLEIMTNEHLISKEFVVHTGEYNIEMKAKHTLIESGGSISADIRLLLPSDNLAGDQRILAGVYYKPLSTNQENTGTINEKKIDIKNGQGEINFTLPDDIAGGVYVLKAEGEDDMGNKITSKLEFIVNSKLSETENAEKGVWIFADSTEYFVGGKAKLLIISPQASNENKIKTLISYSGSEILKSEFIELTSQITPLYVEINEMMLPNFYVDIIALSGLKIDQSSINLMVNKREKEIKIDLISTPANPSPGEDISIKIRTYDYQNRAIPSVVTLKVSKKDTEEVRGDKWNLLDYFYPERGLQIISASNLSIPNYIDNKENINVDESSVKSHEKGNAMYFNSLITTDDGGYAQINFKLPSYHANWQMDAMATSDKMKFGTSHASLTAIKPLIIYPITPSFLVSGDKVRLEAKIFNQSDRDLETKIELVSDDINVKSGVKKNIFIKPGESIIVNWDAEILPVDSDKIAKIAYRAKEGYIETNVPIKSLISPEIITEYGVIEEKWETVFKISKDIIKNIGGLFISIGGDLNVFINQNIEVINDYSYNSNELIASSLIAKLLISKTGLKDEVNKIIFDIEKTQLEDGGYPIWKEDKSDTLITAYILYALNSAENQEFIINSDAKNSTIRFLWRMIKEDELSSPDLSFIIWVLSEANQHNTTLVVNLLKNRSDLSIRSKAFLLMTSDNLLNAGQKSIQSFISRLQSEIITEKISDGEFSYFEDQITTAIVLMALERVSSDNPVNNQILKYLISSKTYSGRRTNLRELVWRSIVFSELNKQIILIDNDLETIVSTELNNQIIINEPIDTENINSVYSTFVPMKTIIGNDELNNIIINKEGVGNIYYLSKVKYFLENERAISRAEGVLLEHNYYNSDGKIVNEFKKGNIYTGKLTIIVPSDMKYVVLEELLPAGAKPIVISSDFENFISKNAIEEGGNWVDNPLWNFTDYEIQDSRILFYAKNLPSGVYNIEYELQAVISGEYNLLPASIHEMHNSSIYAQTRGKKIIINN